MGFVFNEEFSADWPHLQQTRVLIFHSWIAEYANVGNITGLSESFIPSFYSILAYKLALFTTEGIKRRTNVTIRVARFLG